MRRDHALSSLLFTVLGVSSALCAAAEEHPNAVLFDDSEIVSTEYPSWFKLSFMDLQDDLADARDGGKTGLMLFFDSDGCAYCRAFLEHTFNDPGLQAGVREKFDVIGLDMFGDIEITDFSGHRLTMKDFALREGVTMSPTVIFYGTDGTRLLRTVGYHPPARFRVLLDYLVGGHFATESLRAYTAKRTPQRSPQPAAPQTDPLFEEEPYAFDRSRLPAQRPLLVLFEDGDCAECLRLRSHVLSYAPVRRLLTRYDAVRLDWSDAGTPLVTTTGARSNPAAWAERLNIAQVPALVFFDETGREVFRLDSLVLRQRMERALLYVLENAYLRGMTYQQFTRGKTIEKRKVESSSAASGG